MEWRGVGFEDGDDGGLREVDPGIWQTRAERAALGWGVCGEYRTSVERTWMGEEIVRAVIDGGL